jgi:predicted dehydrogenase
MAFEPHALAPQDLSGRAEVVAVAARSEAQRDAVRSRFRFPTVASVQISIPWWRPQGYDDQPGRGTLARDGGAVLLTQAIHTLDLALALAGPVDEVFAYAATTPLHRMETEDLATGVLRFAGGAIVALSATTACYPGGTEQIRLIGEKGSACLEGEALQVDFLDGGSSRLGSAGIQDAGADPMAFSHASHRALLAAFFDAVEAGRAPTPGGREALEVQLLVDALLRSAQTGRPSRPDRADVLQASGAIG